eukprot:CAMPEP_0119282530 /NCGR_PEP_ID=MMETSP1329-20130426/26910_1 /TAXON_ID=114041 /ORGANISM="Genus nov. species nov., Strain RCC1024" /LENGTH=381 /DNA_ID=CAMNT_0007283191 /DNA_START=95 /DNA_END=1237 /DNA_ORIENTATION=+
MLRRRGATEDSEDGPEAEAASRKDQIINACVGAALEYIEKRRGDFPATAARVDRTLEKASEARESAAALTAAMSERVRELRPQRSLRKALTGDADTRIRDHVKTMSQEPRVVKAVDKCLFTGGVAWVGVTEYVILCHADLLGLWYVATIAPLLCHRVVTYLEQGYYYFLLDFCYAVTLLCCGIVACDWLAVALPPRVFAVAFACCNGPILSAIIGWRNSFVFHSLDHVTSTVLHALPPVWTFATRWAIEGDAPPDLVAMYVYSVLFYCVWQLLYILKTEWLDAEYIRESGDTTALRWLTEDTRNGMNRLCRFVMVKLGGMEPGELFDYRQLKTKLIFWGGQLCYTLVTLAPAPLFWRYRLLHLCTLLFMYTTAIYNGASYY